MELATAPQRNSTIAQRRFAVYAAQTVKRLWSQVGNDFDADWSQLINRAADTIAIAQTAASIDAAMYVPASLQDADFDAPPVGDIDTTAYRGTNRYGMSLVTALQGATTTAKSFVGEGWGVQQAKAGASRWLTSTTLTAVADTGREVAATDIGQRPGIGGYVRVLNSPSCARCIVLAGKWFRWNEGFQRHPRCDCKHVPARDEDEANQKGLISDPYEAFNRLDEAAQDRLFGATQARAIRDGADIYRVTNIAGVPGSTRLSRGLANVTGRSGWQGRLYGTPSRFTLDDIFAAAGSDREKAIQLMADEGYITGPQTTGGNIKGRYFEGYAGVLGRGGTRKGATYAFQRAQATGIRDPFSPDGVSQDPATQTAAERRFHRAYLDLHYAKTYGRDPWSTSGRPLSAKQLRDIEGYWRLAKEDLVNQPLQVRRLAALLGEP